LAGRVTASGRSGERGNADFLMLQAINGGSRCSRTAPNRARCIPKELYRLYVAAAGELATFTAASKRRPALPVSRHDRLRQSFEPVMAALARIAECRARAVGVPIRWNRVASVSTWRCRRTDRCTHAAGFVWRVRADTPVESCAGVPVAAAHRPVEQIQELMRLALQACREPAARAPRQILLSCGFVYFEMDQSHEAVERAQELGRHRAPGIGRRFPGLDDGAVGDPRLTRRLE
jgi:type VI secretion system protein ImpJ